MMILRPKDKERLRAIFKTSPISIEVWAYGSRVNGDAHEGSDLDLVILTPDSQKLPIGIYLDLKEKIRESNIPIIVELFDWKRLPENFHRNIVLNHEVLFSNNTKMVNEVPAKYKNTDKEN